MAGSLGRQGAAPPSPRPSLRSRQRWHVPARGAAWHASLCGSRRACCGCGCSPAPRPRPPPSSARCPCPPSWQRRPAVHAGPAARCWSAGEGGPCWGLYQGWRGTGLPHALQAACRWFHLGALPSMPSLPPRLPSIFADQRELPVSAEFLLENLLDPAHINFAHHGVIGRRSRWGQRVQQAGRAASWHASVRFHISPTCRIPACVPEGLACPAPPALQRRQRQPAA